MAKQAATGMDEARLKKKLGEKLSGHDSSKGDPGIRKLRKRLKRIQRKRRAHALRKKRAAGKKAEAPAQA